MIHLQRQIVINVKIILSENIQKKGRLRMISEFPEVFQAINEVLNNQNLYYLNSQQYRGEQIVTNRHPIIMINDFGFMTFAEYFHDGKYIKFHVFINGESNFIGTLQYSNYRLQFYKTNKPNEIKDFSIELLNELYEKITIPLLNKIKRMKNNQ